MKLKVTYFQKCEYCGIVQEFVLRDESVASDASDSDVKYQAFDKLLRTSDKGYCKFCEMWTRQKVVAIKGLED